MGSAAAERTSARHFWAPSRLHGGLWLLATVLVIVLGVLLYPSVRGGHQAHAAARSFVLLQMNLCLSGQAGCFQDVQYPRGVLEARARIDGSHADAVTLDEVCRGDVEALAHDTGYHMRFAAVGYRDQPLRCHHPGDRGLYGIAILTKAGVRSSVGHAYEAQDEIEQRHWICATTTDAVTVCATHLEVRGTARTESVNDAQCVEFTQVLDGFQRRGPLIAAGDMNRWESCAPAGMWARGDDNTAALRGVQHVYGDAQFREPAANVLPMRYSDHDALVVTSRQAA